MGVCCSKKSVVAVGDETGKLKTTNGFMKTETVGNAGEVQTGNGTAQAINVVTSSEEILTRETETVNNYDNQNNSANRSTLIFPSYSGYQTSSRPNQAFSSQARSNDQPPRAYVSPIQSGPSGSPLTNRSALDLLTSRSSPTVSRYSTLVTPTLQRRNIPSPFAVRSSKVTNTMLNDGGDFDSDLDSDSEQSPKPVERIQPLDFTLPNSTEVTTEGQTNSTKHISVSVAVETNDAATEAVDDKVEMVDVSVGTDNDQVTRSNVSVQVSRGKKNTKHARKTATTGTEADLPVSQTPTQSAEKPQTVPKIVTEYIDDVEKPKPRKRSPSPRPPSSAEQPKKEKPERDPIIETLENAFYRFARYGEVNSEGKEMNNKNWAKLCRDCEFVDNRSILVGDVDVIFSRHKLKGERLITFEMFLNCLNEVADRILSKKIKDERKRREVIYNNVIGKAPELIGITGVSRTGNVNRMTDHTLYPATHKMRFDEEGRGLGIDDKFEYIDAQFGYVNGYKGRDQYDQKFANPRSRSGSMTSTSGRPHSSSSSIRPSSSASKRSQSPR